MNKRDRSELFARYVGLALKGRIITQGKTAKAVATEMQRSPAAFNRWLNGKVEIPLSVFAEACEVIDVEPHTIVEDAYSRLCLEHGERDGTMHPEDSSEDYSYPGEHESNVIVGGFGQNASTEEIPENVEEEWAGLYAAQKKGVEPEEHTP
ncbi:MULTISPECIES: helix-turn-helix transcriptional regulator [unclassified Leucobacter]|uniref:helix-turn-helix domain-containing protein n=1 Tax=unclassified Leucobacter TaxID=2621730 RepID=UPI00165DD690|nr:MULTISPECIES: helix-turn-helix transcriptional regulator [unclassified Leucobacter]